MAIPDQRPLFDRFRLNGRVALITGAARGLGLAMADALARAGASVVVTSREAPVAAAAAKALGDATGARTLGIACDVRVDRSVDAMIGEAVASLGRLDILVNNAGTTQRGPLSVLTISQWDEVLDTNLRGSWLCARAAVPVMRRGGWGRIVNIASMFASVGLPNRTPYVASKGGVVAMTRALAVELAPDGITANALCPGPFLTDMHDAAARSAMLAQIPLGRWGDPAELGPAVVFLASEASSFMTGASIAIDGGYTAR
jgi:NAD(P)-dependent dehydrogenase (short-subunit alcohol dehydrogenase family)